MADMNEYRNRVREVIRKYGAGRPLPEDIEGQLVFDAEHDHYQLVNVGWHDGRRVYGCVLHLDLKDGKVWIQHNGTEVEIGDELVGAEIPKHDIVVGFHSPYKRQFTEFAVG